MSLASLKEIFQGGCAQRDVGPLQEAPRLSDPADVPGSAGVRSCRQLPRCPPAHVRELSSA